MEGNIQKKLILPKAGRGKRMGFMEALIQRKVGN